MKWFYDHQLKRYIVQLIRLFSEFKYKDGDGEIHTVPILYGDLSRQVGAILRDNSENKVPSAPRMALFVTRLELDRQRLSDPSFVQKTHIREREIDDGINEYLQTQGRNYTIEKPIPTPYNLSISVDIWSTNTDQKLQILEQILMLFNPSLDIQTTDNYIDWANISTVYLEEITWTSRTIPSGTESDIDVATLGFSLPIYISPPVKVKRLGIITDIISRVHDSSILAGDVDTATSVITNFKIDSNGNIINTESTVAFDSEQTDSTINAGLVTVIKTNHKNTVLYIENDVAKISKGYNLDYLNWNDWLAPHSGKLIDNVSQIRIKKTQWPYEVVGRMLLNPSDHQHMIIDWDVESFPKDTIIPGPIKDRNKIDFIIDPTRTNPNNLSISVGTRILILGPIGHPDNQDGANAWKDVHGNDFIANTNDIIEWTGEEWVVVFDSVKSELVYSNQIVSSVHVSNLKTLTQYTFFENEWLLSIDGEYPPGTWRVVL